METRYGAFLIRGWALRAGAAGRMVEHVQRGRRAAWRLAAAMTLLATLLVGALAGARPTGAATLMQITDPALVPNQRVYDFAPDAPGSAPTTVPGGTFAHSGSVYDVRVVGIDWSSWNPQT